DVCSSDLILGALQHVQRGEGDRAGPVGSGAGTVTPVQVRIEDVGAKRKIAFGVAYSLRLAAEQDVDQLRVAGQATGIGRQLLQRLVEGADLAFAPGPGDLCAVYLLAGLQAEPDQRAGDAQAEQPAGQAGQQAAQTAPGTALRGFGVGGVGGGRVLGAALEEFHGSPRVVLMEGSVAAGMSETRSEERRVG